MPYLLCPTHGEEQEAECRKKQEAYRREGETVLVARGRLISGPWNCDRCNAELEKGDPAMLMTAFPSHLAEALADYDYEYEGEYFAVEKMAVDAYGARPPGGVAKPPAAGKR